MVRTSLSRRFSTPMVPSPGYLLLKVSTLPPPALLQTETTPGRTDPNPLILPNPICLAHHFSQLGQNISRARVLAPVIHRPPVASEAWYGRPCAPFSQYSMAPYSRKVHPRCSAQGQCREQRPLHICIVSIVSVFMRTMDYVLLLLTVEA